MLPIRSRPIAFSVGEHAETLPPSESTPPESYCVHVRGPCHRQAVRVVTPCGLRVLGARDLNSSLLLSRRGSSISNVPGPDVPLYLAGAELLAYYPVSAIFDGNGLNITVMSYRGTLYFGLVVCRELMPGLDDLAE